MAYILDTTGEYVVNSDERLKRDIEPLPSVLDNVMQLQASSYQFVNQSNQDTRRSIGFIAQDVQPLFPELVSEKDGTLGLSYAQFAVVAIKAIQEQQAEIEELRARLEALER
jgi:hypothetical protein